MPDAGELDELDRELLAQLSANGRATFSELGQRVGLSAPAVKRRIERLEARGVITGYTVLIDDAKLANPIEAFTELRFAGDTKVEDIAGIAIGIGEVSNVFTIAGIWTHSSTFACAMSATSPRSSTASERNGRVTGTKTLIVLNTWTNTSRVRASEQLTASRAEINRAVGYLTVPSNPLGSCLNMLSLGKMFA